jgi:hypothetical protein
MDYTDYLLITPIIEFDCTDLEITVFIFRLIN